MYAGDFSGMTDEMRTFMRWVSMLLTIPVVISSGSGFFIDDKGHILTNWHVVAEQMEFNYNGEKIDVEVTDAQIGVEAVADHGCFGVDEDCQPTSGSGGGVGFFAQSKPPDKSAATINAANPVRAHLL